MSTFFFFANRASNFVLENLSTCEIAPPCPSLVLLMMSAIMLVMMIMINVMVMLIVITIKVMNVE